MKLLLDTHVLHWAATAVVGWEIAIKQSLVSSSSRDLPSCGCQT